MKGEIMKLRLIIVRPFVGVGLVLFLSAPAQGWDIGLRWSRQLDGHSMSATGLFDLDQNSVPELLVAGNSHLYCYDTAGNLAWSFVLASNYWPAVSAPLAADINGDSQLEVVVSSPLAVYVLSADGDSLWRRTLAGQGSVQNCIASVALGDINHDNRLEIFQYEVYANRLLCLEPLAGDTVWTFVPTGANFFSVGTPTVADINQDSRLEVLGQVSFSGGGGQLYCLNDSGRELWHYNTPGSGIGGWQLASAAVADLDDDDSLEVVSTANYWGVFCLDCHGNELWTRRRSQHAAAYPAIGDVDGDDSLEVVVALGDTMYCLNGRTGATEWAHPVQTGYYIVSSPALCDLNGDGLLEVVFAEVKQNNPSDPNRPMWVLDFQGNPSWHDTVGTTMSDPTVGDINCDGKLEFCIGPTFRSAQFWLFGTDTAVVAPGTVQWPTLQHDIWRTGWYGYPGPPVGVTEGRNQPFKASQGRVMAWPNPFTGCVNIRLAAQAAGSDRLAIYDASGRLVRVLIGDNAAGSDRSDFVWDGSEQSGKVVGPGLYFCRTGAGQTVRLVKLNPACDR